MAVHLHTPVTTRRLLQVMVWASLPAAAIGIWNLGHQLLRTAQPAPLLDLLGLNPAPDSIAACLIAGAAQAIPLFAVAALTSAGWAWAFSRLRNQPVDPGWFSMAWLFVLLLPASTTLAAAALAMSFGAVVGAHIFGGTGRYLASPALLGVLFLSLSYPDFTAQPLMLGQDAPASSWTRLSADGIDGAAWLPYLLGRGIGAIGTTSALACLLGAAYLIHQGAASWRVCAGAVAGILVAGTVLHWTGASELPAYWHLVLGNLAFVLAFVITDPGAAPLTRPARWMLGIFTGVLTVLIRVFDPAHPEATLHAALLTTLAVPLIDYLVVRRAWREPAAR